MKMKLNNSILLNSSSGGRVLSNAYASASALENPIKITYNPRKSPFLNKLFKKSKNCNKIVHFLADGEFNVWMYGVIFIGCTFVLFVIAGIYVMW